jgi:uncharacterized OB-fold protein
MFGCIIVFYVKLRTQSQSQGHNYFLKEVPMSEQEIILQPQAWEVSKNGVVLKPSYCGSCNQHFFPPIKGCTSCFCQNLEQVEVGGEGILYSYTTIRVPRQGYPQEYSVAYVDFPDLNMRVFGRLSENGPYRLGTRAKLVTGIIYERGGVPVNSYMFEIKESDE